MLKITILIGNPNANSRTLQVARHLVRELLGSTIADTSVIDLAEHAEYVFAPENDEMVALRARLSSSNLIVVASPTYKASYTGLLKAFLDQFPPGKLRGIVAIGMMTGADARHTMGVDIHLVPLLTEMGAVVLARGFYFITGEMGRLEDAVKEKAQDYRQQLQALRVVAEGIACLPSRD